MSCKPDTPNSDSRRCQSLGDRALAKLECALPTKQNSFSQQPTVRGSPEIDSQSVRLGPQDPVHVQGVGSGPDKVIEDSGDGDMGTFKQYFEAEPNITKLSRHAKS